MTGVRQGARRSRDLSAALVAMLVTVIAWQVLSRAAASLLVSAQQPDAALAFRPSDGAGLTSLASIVIARRPGQKSAGNEARIANARSAQRLTDRALADSPLQTTALTLRAQSSEMVDDQTKADRIMNVAGAQTIRDPIVNLYLLNQDVARRAYASALFRADALLRVSSEVAPNVYPLLDRMALQPESRRAFIATLGAGPPWRAGFLSSVTSQVGDPMTFLDTLLALKTAPVPLTDVELRAFLDPLVKRAMIEQAYYIWLQFLPPQRLKELPYLYNGSFVYKLTNLPFDWTIMPIEGATTTFETIPGQDQRRLAVQFDGKRVRFMNVVQMLLLPPGGYQFSGSYRSDGLNNPRGMTWRLYCAQRNDSIPIAETERISGTSNGWKDFATVFKIPAQKCGAQWLRLELASRVSIEEMVSGSASYTNLKISRADGSEAKPILPTISLPSQPGTAFERAIRDR